MVSCFIIKYEDQPCLYSGIANKQYPLPKTCIQIVSTLLESVVRISEMLKIAHKISHFKTILNREQFHFPNIKFSVRPVPSCNSNITTNIGVDVHKRLIYKAFVV